jgi:hypothetical protein
MTRQQLYNVINGRSAVTPEMAVRFEKTFGGDADMWLKMQATHDVAKVRQSQQKIAVSRGQGDLRHFTRAPVEGIADRTPIGARTLIAARQGFADVNKNMVAVTGHLRFRTNRLTLARSRIRSAC